MNDKKLEAENSSANVAKSSRRKFLVKASAGTLIATLPAKTVWANVITNSMVASGHGSDFNAGVTVQLQGPNFWCAEQSRLGTVLNDRFVSIFGGAAINNAGLFDSHLTLRQVLCDKTTHPSGSETFTYDGPSGINRLLISTYLSAKFTDNGMFPVDYPVVGLNHRPFRTFPLFAHRLYGLAAGNANQFASELHTLITNPRSLVV